MVQRHRSRSSILLLAAAIPWRAAAGADASPDASGLVERARADLVQLEFTAWPAGGRLELCRGLTDEMLAVSVNGEYPKFMLDRLGFVAEPAAPAERNRQARSWVLFFDDTLLGSCAPAQEGPRQRAFGQSREFIGGENFRPDLGDRIMIASYSSNGLQFHTGWEARRDVLRRALDELEVNQVVSRPQVNDLGRWAAYRTLALATADLEGMKHVVMLAADVPVNGGSAGQLRELEQLFHMAQVTLHTVDLIWDSRGSTITYGLGALARESGGGHLFGSGQTVDTAAQTLNEMYRNGCRLLLSFDARDVTFDTRIAEHISITSLDRRFRIEAPQSFKDPRRVTAAEEVFAARVQRPRWGSGIRLEAGLWPLAPTADSHWRSLVLARLVRVDDEPLPEGIERGLALYVGVGRGTTKRSTDSVVTRIAGTQLARFLESGASAAFILPLSAEAGTNHLRIVASTLGDDGQTPDYRAGGSVRATLAIPRPPREDGQSTDWMLVDGLARVDGTVFPRPAIDGTLLAGTRASFLSYGCFDPQGLAGVVRSAADETTTEVPIARLPAARELISGLGHCGWFQGEAPVLPPGLYTFEPPGTRGRRQSLRFRIETPDAERIAAARAN